MGRPGLEEEPVMNQEMRDAFEEIKESVKDSHAETREKISDFGRTLNKHMLEDALMAKTVHDHLEEEKAGRKWRWTLWAGLIIALVTTAAERIFAHWKG